MELQDRKYYIDVNVFLAPILYDLSNNSDAQLANLFLKRLINNEIIGFTSVLTWDEFVWIVRKVLNKEESIKKGQKFLQFPYLRFIETSLEIIKIAQEFLEKYPIKPRDAIHLATAITNGIYKIVTFDNDFKDISEISSLRPF
ncbi:MAG: type II toxin-antitoxin system VapC family toxin [Candidatus Helarchaeota archaeon]